MRMNTLLQNAYICYSNEKHIYNMTNDKQQRLIHINRYKKANNQVNHRPA